VNINYETRQILLKLSVNKVPRPVLNSRNFMPKYDQGNPDSMAEQELQKYI